MRRPASFLFFILLFGVLGKAETLYFCVRVVHVYPFCHCALLPKWMKCSRCANSGILIMILLAGIYKKKENAHCLDHKKKATSKGQMHVNLFYEKKKMFTSPRIPLWRPISHRVFPLRVAHTIQLSPSAAVWQHVPCRVCFPGRRQRCGPQRQQLPPGEKQRVVSA